jgi:hypothetical protein
MVRIAVLAITSIALAALPASAQSSDSGRPGHGFATVGAVGVTGDPADDVNVMGQTVNRGHLLVSAAVFVAPRIGVGIETLPEHDTSAQTADYESFSEQDQLQEKTTLMVTARGRTVAGAHFAIDGVFGVGALRQTRTTTTQFRYPPFQTTTTTTDHTSAAFSLGADAPISVVRHLTVIPQMRWYHLRRLGNQVSYPAQTTPLAFDTPGSLFAFGVTAGVTW